MNAVNFALSGRVTVITGAAQGIGAACAEPVSYTHLTLPTICSV